ncbi:MAG: glycoside hydrolase family 172 protein [Gemmatimonadaceae bacterium]
MLSRLRTLTLGALLFALPLAAQRPASGSEAVGMGLRALTRLDELALPRRAVRVGAFSSADPSGENDDGFSGKHSFLRREGDGLVIAELTGPGVVTRIWTPTPTDDPVEFYFDGESTPRLVVPFRRLFVDGVPPFRGPLVGFGAGGYYSYVPLPFATSLKVIVRGARVQFHQVNWAAYPAGSVIESWTPRDTASTGLATAAADFATAGANLSRRVAPPGSVVTRHAVTRTLPPGRATTVYESTRGGRIVGLRLAPAAALMADERATLVRVTWDGAATPAIEAPVEDLFGGAWGKPAMAGLLAGAVRDTAYLWFPMPYDRAARVELVQAPNAAPRPVFAEVFTSDVARRPGEGRFHAIWRHENPTTPGRPFTYLQSEGSGHIVGVTLQAQGIGTDGTPFFEGDDRVVVDGDTIVKGTGSEDSFNGGWYDIPGRWDARRAFPLSGALGYSNALARTGGYRFFLGDAYPWSRRIDFTIEHGETVRNEVPGDYSAVTYLYATTPLTMRSTPWTPASRRRVAPDRITVNAGWSSSITFFSTRFARISKESENGIGRFLSFVGDSTPELGRHVLSLGVPVATAGRYRISIIPVTGPGQGTVQLLRDDQPTGAPVDTRADTRRVSEPKALGELELEAGDATLHLRITPSVTGTRRAALDLVRVVLERVSG